MNKTYSELVSFPTFAERFDYVKLHGAIVGDPTFGPSRYLNQFFYRSAEWKSARNRAIIRDSGYDLAHPEYSIGKAGMIIVHHINPLTEEDILLNRACLYDLENLICVSHNTHNAVHFGDASLLPQLPVQRYPGDTIPWKRCTT